MNLMKLVFSAITKCPSQSCFSKRKEERRRGCYETNSLLFDSQIFSMLSHPDLLLQLLPLRSLHSSVFLNSSHQKSFLCILQGLLDFFYESSANVSERTSPSLLGYVRVHLWFSALTFNRIGWYSAVDTALASFTWLCSIYCPHVADIWPM